MVIGNVSLRIPPATGGVSITDLSDGTPQPVQWICPRSNTTEPLYPPDSDGLHGVGIQDPTNTGAGVGFPDQYCDGYASPMRADIHFPSCYDPSKGLDDYEENMVWPTNGNCPEGFTHVPHLFYEVYWNTPLFSDEWTAGGGTQPWVLSNGDPTGYSLHADFVSILSQQRRLCFSLYLFRSLDGTWTPCNRSSTTAIQVMMEWTNALA